MTSIIFDLKAPQLNGLIGVNAVINIRQMKRRIDGNVYIFPRGYKGKTVAGKCEIEIEPTGIESACYIDILTDKNEHVTGAFFIPNKETENYVDLVEVDPKTLEPDAEPDPAWWAVARATVNSGEVIGDDLILTRTDGVEINAGNVRGLPGQDGADGVDGAPGRDGVDGAPGRDGISVVDTAIDANGDLLVTLSDDHVVNAGRARGHDGKDGLIDINQYGVLSDGTTDDTQTFKNVIANNPGKVFTASSPGLIRITSAITLPENFKFKGILKFKKDYAGGIGVTVLKNSIIDKLYIECVGNPTGNDSALYVRGENTSISEVEVKSLQSNQSTGGTMAVTVGNASSGATASQDFNIRISSMKISGFDRCLRLWNLRDSRIDNINISNFTVGVYVVRVSDCTFNGASIKGTSPTSTGTPGQNGLLIESTLSNGYTDFSTRNLTFIDWTVDGAPEHGYRIGGDVATESIKYIRCRAINSGNAPGNIATGGSGFKALGGRTEGAHTNVVYIDCEVIDSSTTGNGLNNFSAWNIGVCDGMKIYRPAVRAVNKTYSTQNGIYINSSKNISIVEPDIRDCKLVAMWFIKDGTDPFFNDDGVENIIVSGGILHSAETHAFAMTTKNTISKNVQLNGVQILGNSMVSRAVRVDAATLVEAAQGAYIDVMLDIYYMNVIPGGAEPAIVCPNSIMIKYRGNIYGYSHAGLPGSTTLNMTTGEYRIMTSNGWRNFLTS